MDTPKGETKGVVPDHHRIEEVVVEEEGELQYCWLFDTTYNSEFFGSQLSEEEWKEIIGTINSIWKPAALNLRGLQKWYYAIVCFLPCLICEEKRSEKVFALLVTQTPLAYNNWPKFLEDKRRELVEYLHQVNMTFQDRGLLFDMREHSEHTNIFINVYKIVLDPPEFPCE